MYADYKKFNKFISFIIFLIGFWIYGAWFYKDYFLAFFNKYPFFYFLKGISSDYSMVIFLIKSQFLILPIAIITLCEALKSFKNRKDNFNLSLARINKSKGFKFADVYYWLAVIILRNKYPFIFSFLTLGIPTFYHQINIFLREFYVLLGISTFSSLFWATIAILLLDFSGFISHYLRHKNKFLWNFHMFHHSATEMTIFSKFRESPYEILAQFIVVPINTFAFLLLTSSLTEANFIPLIIICGYKGLREFWDYLAHSSYKMIYPKPISYILMSPSLHWIHHSSNPKHFNMNFGDVFSIWDRFFGTYLGEQHLSEISSYGFAKSKYNKVNPFNALFIHPIELTAKLIRSNQRKA